MNLSNRWFYSIVDVLMDVVIFRKKLEKTGELEIDFEHSEEDEKKLTDRYNYKMNLVNAWMLYL